MILHKVYDVGKLYNVSGERYLCRCDYEDNNHSCNENDDDMDNDYNHKEKNENNTKPFK